MYLYTENRYLQISKMCPRGLGKAGSKMGGNVEFGSWFLFRITSPVYSTYRKYFWETVYLHQIFLKNISLRTQDIFEKHQFTVYVHKIFLRNAGLRAQNIFEKRQFTCTKYFWKTVYVHKYIRETSVYVHKIFLKNISLCTQDISEKHQFTCTNISEKHNEQTNICYFSLLLNIILLLSFSQFYKSFETTEVLSLWESEDRSPSTCDRYVLGNKKLNWYIIYNLVDVQGLSDYYIQKVNLQDHWS